MIKRLELRDQPFSPWEGEARGWKIDENPTRNLGSDSLLPVSAALGPQYFFLKSLD